MILLDILIGALLGDIWAGWEARMWRKARTTFREGCIRRIGSWGCGGSGGDCRSWFIFFGIRRDVVQ